MRILKLTTLLVFTASLASAPAMAQDGAVDRPPVQQPPNPTNGQIGSPNAPPETQVEDIVVIGQRGLDVANRFVLTVAPPIGEGGVARWRSAVCVGVANMQAEAAQAMADRISDWAHSFGIEIAPPGCQPNIFVVLTDDGDETAAELVASRRRDFRTGASGSDRGASALERFQTSGRPVRWWHVSLPVNPDTGKAANRLPGQGPFEVPPRMTRPADFGPNASTGLASGLRTQFRDDLQQLIVVIDTVALETAEFGQLSDYAAMVALAPIDAEADTRSFRSILNLFDPVAESVSSLTDWDRAFLAGLYSAEQNHLNPRANASAVADAMTRRLEAMSGDPQR